MLFIVYWSIIFLVIVLFQSKFIAVFWHDYRSLLLSSVYKFYKQSKFYWFKIERLLRMKWKIFSLFLLNLDYVFCFKSLFLFVSNSWALQSSSQSKRNKSAMIRPMDIGYCYFSCFACCRYVQSTRCAIFYS